MVMPQAGDFFVLNVVQQGDITNSEIFKVMVEPGFSSSSRSGDAESGIDVDSGVCSTNSPPPLMNIKTPIGAGLHKMMHSDEASNQSDTPTVDSYLTSEIPVLSSQEILQENCQLAPDQVPLQQTKRRGRKRKIGIPKRSSLAVSTVEKNVPLPEISFPQNHYNENARHTQLVDSDKELKESYLFADDGEKYKETEMPKLYPIFPIFSTLPEFEDFDMSSSSSAMPVLFPMIQVAVKTDVEIQKNLQSNCSTTVSNSRSSMSGSPCSSTQEVTLPKKHRPATLQCVPSDGQISLRGYYYGWWNWGDEVNGHTSVIRRKQQKKPQFEAEFLMKYKNWRSEMKARVLCNLCPGEIVKNTDVMCHIMEHIKIGNSGDWELTKLETTPRLSSLRSQCRLCFRKCPSVLHSHMKQVHQYLNAICCRICEIEFDSIKEMTMHHSKFHNVAEMPYCCPICECRSSFRWDMIRHFQFQHGTGSHVMCPFCLKICDVEVLNGLFVLQYHLLAHKAEPEIDCPRCSLKFVDTDDLDHHLLNHHRHPKEINGDDTFGFGFQLFKEEDKQQPIFINHPNRPLVKQRQ